MTVDFGFFQSGPTAVTLTSIRTSSPTAGSVVRLSAGLMLFGLAGLGAFAWRKQLAR